MRPVRPRLLLGFIEAMALIIGLLALMIAPNASAKPSRADFFGLTSPGQFSDESEASQVQSIGVHNVRIDFVWGDVQKATDYTGEHPAGPRNWSFYDRIVENIALHKMNIVANLYGTRGTSHCDALGCSAIWEKAYPNPTNQPNAWSEYVEPGGFVEAIVNRYGPGGTFWASHPSLPLRPIYVWEVWNEPNRGLNTYGFTPNPAAYDYFLVQMASRIRTTSEYTSGAPVSVNGTQVLLGGLNTTTSKEKSLTGEPEWIDGRVFLERMYSQRPASVSASQLRGAYDGISLHPYAVTGTPEQAEAKVLEFRSMMVSPLVENAGKNMWVTELGWPSTRWGKESGSFPASGTTPKTAITEAQQAKYLGQFLNWLYAEADERKIVYAAPYTYSDVANEDGTLCGEWSCWDKVAGLTSAAGTHKPAWCEFRLILGYSGACSGGTWKGDNLGGSITSTPSISSSRPGDLDVFVRGSTASGYQLYHKVWLSEPPGPGWFPSSTGWEPLGGYLLSAPASVSPEGGRVDVVARELVEGADELMHRWWDGTKWNSEKLGNPGKFQGAPAIASWGPGRLDIFARGASNEVWHRYYDNGAWSAWENRGGSITSSPAAVSWGPGRYDMVARLSNNTIQQWYKTPSMGETQIWGTYNLGGFATDDPGIASWGPFRLDLFVPGPSRAVYHRAYEVGEGWWPASEWQNLGSVANTGIAATSWEPGRIDMVYGGSPPTIGHTYWSEP